MDRVERWVSRLQQKVEHCEQCQPYDPEEQEIIWVLGDRVSVGEFLSESHVPEALQEEVASRLRCFHCGNGEFGLWDDIGLETTEEREHRERWKRWERLYRVQLDEFEAHLERYPFLGLSHPLGRKIHRTIREFPLTKLGTTKWWRARKPDGAKAFSALDMAPPPPDKATVEGRFNHYGQVVFYLASSPNGALAETLDVPRGEAMGWVQRFSIPSATKVLNLVEPDFGEQGHVPILALGLMNRLPHLVPRRDAPWKPEYFIPRFIADCAREHGIVGVVFESQKHFDTNLALFRWSETKVRAIRAPRLERFSGRLPADELDEF